MNDSNMVAHELIIKVMMAMDRVVRTPEEIAELPLEYLCPDMYQQIFDLAAAASVAVMEEVVRNPAMHAEEQTKWS